MGMLENGNGRATKIEQNVYLRLVHLGMTVLLMPTLGVMMYGLYQQVNDLLDRYPVIERNQELLFDADDKLEKRDEALSMRLNTIEITRFKQQDGERLRAELLRELGGLERRTGRLENRIFSMPPSP